MCRIKDEGEKESIKSMHSVKVIMSLPMDEALFTPTQEPPIPPSYPK